MTCRLPHHHRPDLRTNTAVSEHTHTQSPDRIGILKFQSYRVFGHLLERSTPSTVDLPGKLRCGGATTDRLGLDANAENSVLPHKSASATISPELAIKSIGAPLT